MPGGRRTANKDLAAARLATGGTVAEAAAAAGVDQRTIFKWKAEDAEFRDRIGELRAQMVSAALGRLSDSMAAAADTLVALVASDDDAVKLRAARAVIELALKVKEQADIEERLARVEAALRGGRDGAGGAAGEGGACSGEPAGGRGAGPAGGVPGGPDPPDA